MRFKWCHLRFITLPPPGVDLSQSLLRLLLLSSRRLTFLSFVLEPIRGLLPVNCRRGSEEAQFRRLPFGTQGSLLRGRELLAPLRRTFFKISKSIHKYLGLALLLYLFAMGASGLLLNNPDLIRGFSVPWAATPANYQPLNWNRFYLRDGAVLGNEWFLAGKPGVVYSGDGGRSFKLLDEGFAGSSYDRDTLGLLALPTPQGVELYAATRSGLHHRFPERPWQRVRLSLDRDQEAVVAVVATAEHTVAFTRQEAYLAPLPGISLPNGRTGTAPAAGYSAPKFTPAPLNVAHDERGRPPVPLFRVLHDLHNGSIIGKTGKWLLDLLAPALIFLSLSALVIWYLPRRMRRGKKPGAKRGSTNSIMLRFCLNYHLKVGIYTLFFLALLALSGTLLRPPLLIALVPYSISAENPMLALSPRNSDWGGNLQQAVYSSASDSLWLATQGGFFQGPADFSAPFQPRPLPVPVHGMGVTVFEEVEPGLLLVGSFLGLYLWEEASGRVQHLPRPGLQGGGNPYMANDLISGLLMADGLPRWRVDYHDGMMPLTPQPGAPLPAMPPEIGKRTPLSLWHYLFELHNGRIFEQWLGMGYLLIIPLGGLALLLILLTGLYDWFYRRP